MYINVNVAKLKFKARTWIYVKQIISDLEIEKGERERDSLG
jgi:hypothetical protein